VTDVVNPSYIAVNLQRQCLYCVEEYAADVQKIGGVSAFRVDTASGALKLLNRQPSHGSEPPYISVDRTGCWVLVANYRSGSIAAYPVGPDGSLGNAIVVVQDVGTSVNPERQSGPHAHWIGPDPANRSVLVVDLGMDAIFTYKFEEKEGKPHFEGRSDVKTPPGSGPRHAAIRPDGRFVYVVTELASTIISYQYNAAAGQLRQIQILSTLPDGYAGKSAGGAARVTLDGRFVYASNRGHDSIAIFASDPATGLLECRGFEPSQGRTPRDFNIDPTGAFLFAANLDSDTVVQFNTDRETGKLSATGRVTKVGSPSSIAFYPMG
jgi:6-phosphogluconolactonase